MLATSSPENAAGRGYLTALGSAAVLSTTAVFIRTLTETYQIPPLVLAAWRAFFVMLTLLLALRWRRAPLLRVERRHLRYLAVYGLALAAFNSFWTLSIAANGAAVATVLSYSSAAFTALLGWRLLREPLTLPKLAAVALSLGGCVLVADALAPAAWTANPLGILTGLLSGLGYAAYSLMGRAAAQRGLNPWTTLLYTFGFATLFLVGVNLLPGALIPGTIAAPADFFWLGRAWGGWGLLLLLAAGPTVAGYGLYNVSLTLLPSSIAHLILTLEPVFTAVIAYFVLSERLTLTQWLGSGLIISGVLILRWGNGRRRAR